MQHAATDSVPISPVLTSDVPHPAPSSSSSPFVQYKIIRRNGSVLMRRDPHGGTMHTQDIQDHVDLGLVHYGEHDVRAPMCHTAKSGRFPAPRPGMSLPANLRGCVVSGAISPFPWMAEMIDLKKEEFFETRATEYQTGGAMPWD